MKTSRPGSSSGLGHFKKQYRSRFTRDIPKLVADIRPDQNALDFIDECFQESDIPDDFTAFLCFPRGCSTPKPSAQASITTQQFHNREIIENTFHSNYACPSTSGKVAAKETTRNDAAKTVGPKADPVTVQNAETLAGNTHVAGMADRLACEKRNGLVTESNSCSELFSVVLEKSAKRSQHKHVSCTRKENNAFEPEKSALQMPTCPTVKLTANKRLSFHTDETSTGDQTSLIKFKKPDVSPTKKYEVSNKDVKLLDNTSVKPTDDTENIKSLLNVKYITKAGTSNKPLSGTCSVKEKNKSPLNTLKQRLARRTEHFRKSMFSVSQHPAAQANQKLLDWNTASFPHNEAGVTELEEEFVIEEADSLTFKSWTFVSSKTKVSRESSHLKAKHRTCVTNRASNILQTENAKDNASNETLVKTSHEVPKLNETFTIDVQSHSYMLNNPASPAKARSKKLQENKADKQVIADSVVPHCEVPEEVCHHSSDSVAVVDSVAKDKKHLEKEPPVTVEESKTGKPKQKSGTQGNVLTSQQQSSKGKKQQPVTGKEIMAPVADPECASENPESTELLKCNSLVQEKVQTKLSVTTVGHKKKKKKKTRQSEVVIVGFENIQLKTKKSLKERGQPKKKQSTVSSKPKKSPKKPGKKVCGSFAVGSDLTGGVCGSAVHETDKDGNNVTQRRTSTRISKPVSMWWICTSETDTQPLLPSENAHAASLPSPLIEHPRRKQRKSTSEKQKSPVKTVKNLQSASSVASVASANEQTSSTGGRCNKEVTETDREENDMTKKHTSPCRKESSVCCLSTTEKNKGLLMLTPENVTQSSLSLPFTAKKLLECFEVAQNVTSAETVASILEEPFTNSNEVGNFYVPSTALALAPPTVPDNNLQIPACPSTPTAQSQKSNSKSSKKRSISDATADAEKTQETKPGKVRKSILKTNKQVFAQNSKKGFRVRIVNDKEEANKASRSDQSGDDDILSTQLKTAQPRRSRILHLLSHKSSGKEQNFRTSLATFDAAYANTPKEEIDPVNKTVVKQSHLPENIAGSETAHRCLKELCSISRQTQRTPSKRRTSVAKSELLQLPSVADRPFSISPETPGLPQPTSPSLAASVHTAKDQTPSPLTMSSKCAADSVSKFLQENTGTDQLHYETSPGKQVHHNHIVFSCEEDKAAAKIEYPEDIAKRADLAARNAEWKLQRNAKQQKRKSTSSKVQESVVQSESGGEEHSSGITIQKHRKSSKKWNRIIIHTDSESSVEQSEGEIKVHRPYILESGPTCHTARFRNPVESPIAFQDQTDDDSPVAIYKPKLVFPSNTPNVRRSKRTRVVPLEYWRGQRADYQQRPSGGFALARILSPGKKKTPYRSKRRGQKKRIQTEDNNSSKLLCFPETEPQLYSVVLDEHGNEVRMACIKPAARIPASPQPDVLTIHKNLIYSNFSAGKLILGPHIEKEYQYVYNNVLVFYIITGSVSVTLHRTAYTLHSGDYFFIPPGNCYSIKNITDSNALLTFTQIKTEEQEQFLPPKECLCPHRR